MSCAMTLVALVLAGTMALQDNSRGGTWPSFCAVDMMPRRMQRAPGPASLLMCRLRGGSRDVPMGARIDEADMIGDVPGEDESDEAPTALGHGTSGDSVAGSDAPRAGENDGVQTARLQKAPLSEMGSIGHDRHPWNGRYWASLEQKRCEVLPSVEKQHKPDGVRPKSILWGEDCAEATMDAPPGYFRPYGDAIPLNDTWIGEWPDGTPALLGDVCCGSGDTRLDLENCYSHSDSRECVDEIVASYRAEKTREQNAAAGTPSAPNPYVTTGWGHPKHPGGPPEYEEFDPTKHDGYGRFLGPGGTPPESQEEPSDEFSDGKWGIDHVEVGRAVPLVRVPLEKHSFWRPGKLGRAQEAEVEGVGAGVADDDDDSGEGEGEGDEADDSDGGDVGFCMNQMEGQERRGGKEKAYVSAGWQEACGSSQVRKGVRAGQKVDAAAARGAADNDAPVVNGEVVRESVGGQGAVHERCERVEEESFSMEEPATPGSSEPSCVVASTAPVGFRQHSAYRKGMGDRERWAMMGKEAAVDLSREFIEGRKFPVSEGGVEHQVSRWNCTREEEERNERLLDRKWREWRRQFEAEVRRRRPRWKNILDPPLDEPSDFNMSFFDHRGRPFPALPAHTADAVVEKTSVAYIKWRLDRAAHRHRFLCDEQERASVSKADSSVTPWVPRNGYSLRWRKSYDGLIWEPEMKRDGDPTIYGSPEEKQKILDEQMKKLRENGEPTCWNCDNSEPSQDEGFYLQALALDPSNTSALCDFGLLKFQEGEESQAENCFERAIALEPAALAVTPVADDFDDAALSQLVAELEGGEGGNKTWAEGGRVGGGIGEWAKMADDSSADVGEEAAAAQARSKSGGGCEKCLLEPLLCEDCAFSPVVTCLSNLAVIKAQRGAYDDAQRLLTAALKMAPRHDRVMVKLADLLLDERGHEDAARALYRRALNLNPAGPEVLYSYGLFLLQFDKNMSAAEEVFVRGVRAAPVSVPMNWAYGHFLLRGKKRRDQAKDSFEWVAKQEMGRDNAEVQTEAAMLHHNVCGELEARWVRGYCGIDQKKRQRLRRVTNCEIEEGDESSALDAALDAFDPLEYRHNTQDADMEKTAVVVRDLPRAEAFYQRALELQPSRVDATLGYCGLLQELGRDPVEVRGLYRRVLAASGGREVCALVSLADYESKVTGDRCEAMRLYRRVIDLQEPDFLRSVDVQGEDIGCTGGAVSASGDGAERVDEDAPLQADLEGEEEGGMGKQNIELAYMEALCGYAETLIETSGSLAALDHAADGAGPGAADVAREHVGIARVLLQHALDLQPDCERAAVALSECPSPDAESSWSRLWRGIGGWMWDGFGRTGDVGRENNRNLAFLEEWVGWGAFEQELGELERSKMSDGGSGGADMAQGKRDRKGDMGSLGARRSKVELAAGPQRVGAGAIAGRQVTLAPIGFGGWVKAGEARALLKAMKRPWAFDAIVAVCARRIARAHAGVVGWGGGGGEKMVTEGGNTADLDEGARTGSMLWWDSRDGKWAAAEERRTHGRWYVEEKILRGVLAEAPRHIGALVVLAELQERVGSRGGGSEQHDYSALLLYKRAYRVCPRAMGVGALRRYVRLLGRVEAGGASDRQPSSRKDQQMPKRYLISRKRALAHQPPVPVIESLVAASIERPSMFEGILGFNSTRGWFCGSREAVSAGSCSARAGGHEKRNVHAMSLEPHAQSYSSPHACQLEMGMEMSAVNALRGGGAGVRVDRQGWSAISKMTRQGLAVLLGGVLKRVSSSRPASGALAWSLQIPRLLGSLFRSRTRQSNAGVERLHQLEGAPNAQVGHLSRVERRRGKKAAKKIAMLAVVLEKYRNLNKKAADLKREISDFELRTSIDSKHADAGGQDVSVTGADRDASPATDKLDLNVVKRKLIIFYLRHDPAKVADVSAIVASLKAAAPAKARAKALDALNRSLRESCFGNDLSSVELASRPPQADSESSHKLAFGEGQWHKRARPRAAVPLPDSELSAQDCYERMCLRKAVRRVDGDLARVKRLLDRHGGWEVVSKRVESSGGMKAIAAQRPCGQRVQGAKEEWRNWRVLSGEEVNATLLGCSSADSRFVQVRGADGAVSYELRSTGSPNSLSSPPSIASTRLPRVPVLSDQHQPAGNFGRWTPDGRGLVEKLGDSRSVSLQPKLGAALTKCKMKRGGASREGGRSDSADDILLARASCKRAHESQSRGQSRAAGKELQASWCLVQQVLTRDPTCEEAHILCHDVTAALEPHMKQRPTCALVPIEDSLDLEIRTLANGSRDKTDTSACSAASLHVLYRALRHLPSSASLHVLLAQDISDKGMAACGCCGLADSAGAGEEEEGGHGCQGILERAVSLDPTYLPALLGLARWNERTGNDGRAIELYCQVLSILSCEASSWNERSPSHGQEAILRNEGLWVENVLCMQAQVMVRLAEVEERDAADKDLIKPPEVLGNPSLCQNFNAEAAGSPFHHPPLSHPTHLRQKSKWWKEAHSKYMQGLEYWDSFKSRPEAPGRESALMVNVHKGAEDVGATTRADVQTSAEDVAWVVEIDPANAHGWAGLARQRARDGKRDALAVVQAWTQAVQLQPYQCSWMSSWARAVVDVVAADDGGGGESMAERSGAARDLSSAAGNAAHPGALVGPVSRSTAAAMLRQAKCLQPANAEVAVALAGVGEEEEALEELERAHALHPTHARVATHLAEVLLEQGLEEDHTRARHLLELVSATSPSAAALFMLGSLAEDDASYLDDDDDRNSRASSGKAQALYRRALSIDPQHVPSLISSADLEDDSLLAGSLYKQALLLEPKQVTALRNWARRCEWSGELEQAQTLYEEALRVAPHDMPSLNQLGVMLWDSKKEAAAAKRVFQQALVIDSFDPVILANYGRVLEEADGNHAQAEMLYRRAIDLQPDDANTLCNLACLLMTKDQDHKGSGASIHIPAPFQNNVSFPRPMTPTSDLHLSPNSIPNLSPCLLEAHAKFRRALELAPFHGGATANLAMVLSTAERVDEARDLVAAALRRYPANEDLLEADRELS